MQHVIDKARWCGLALAVLFCQGGVRAQEDWAAGFVNPPDTARPGVYWYFMDGNLTREGMTADLESMREVGLGNLVFLEVNVGVPRGTVDFLSNAWQELFVHAVREAERLGIEITLGSGPGWAGSGGPWVKPEQSMQHLVATATPVKGPVDFDGILPRPEVRDPYFAGAVTGDLVRQRAEFYRDVVVLAFPTPAADWRIEDVDEKALYYRAPYTSVPGVKPYLPAPAEYPVLPAEAVIDARRIVDLTGHLQPDGRLQWTVPEGDWTIMRFGARNNGATTRPAPRPGFGFECDKLDRDAFDAHFAAYVGKLLDKCGSLVKGRGWTMLHIDSWEMGAQNWTPKFRAEFERRRGYDPLVYLPAFTGRVVGSLERSERFLWDVRLTAQELVLENHAGRLKELGRQHGLRLSIEPYDMNPASDLELGSVADMPMCEFWSDRFGFDSSFSCIESTSIAHTNGRPVVAAEAFTADSTEAWKQYPASVKNQGDWAFCTGINRFVYHTFAHKPLGRRPGMTMGPYGVHWDRGQTWWPMASAYHRYITRCQFLLRQGQTVADICYLIPEGAPHVFRPPASALAGSGTMGDRRGYNFDGCAPSTLLTKARVTDGCVVFPGGARYRLLVLPDVETMTPPLLRKVSELVTAGATVVGPPPRKSPSLVGYPACDQQVAALAEELWGGTDAPRDVSRRSVGGGYVVWGGELQVAAKDRQSDAIRQARWIWYPAGNPAAAAEPGTRYFRRLFSVEPERRVRTARLQITADNDFRSWINGQESIRGDNFHIVYAADVSPLLQTGANLIAVAAGNGGDNPNPAGLIACLHIVFEDGSEQGIVTTGDWTTAHEPQPQWNTLREPLATWAVARPLGPFEMAPWQLDDAVQTDFAELYPNYEATARLLATLDVPPDFTANGPIRYTHRRAAKGDIYFVSNRLPETIEAECTFRVTGRQPELWDPVRGEIRNLPQYREQAGLVSVPLRFAPHQSFFVVFRSDGAASTRQAAGVNFGKLQPVRKISGPWNVAFDPELGGPQQLTMASLEDWSQRPEPGVKYYSGIATYRTTFDLPAGQHHNAESLMLDLGTVHSLARVRLNGRDLGVVWCAPWQVDISQVVQTTQNRLEIDIANLWPNRLIGNKNVVPEQQVGWTNFNPYESSSPLLPSGLLGPVTIQSARTPK